MGAFLPGSANLTGADGAMRVASARVEAEVFSALGVAPLAGRVFSREHAEPGADRVVVIGHRIWQDLFGGRPDIVGQSVRIDAADHTIVGVMPPGFEFPPRASAALWMPLVLAPYVDRGLKSFSVIARVRPGPPDERRPAGPVQRSPGSSTRFTTTGARPGCVPSTATPSAAPP